MQLGVLISVKLSALVFITFLSNCPMMLCYVSLFLVIMLLNLFVLHDCEEKHLSPFVKDCEKWARQVIWTMTRKLKIIVRSSQIAKSNLMLFQFDSAYHNKMNMVAPTNKWVAWWLLSCVVIWILFFLSKWRLLWPCLELI